MWEEQQTARHEYDHGHILTMSGGTRVHSRLATNLIGLLGEALRGTSCQVHGPDMRVATGPRRFLYPDLSVVCGDETFADACETTLTNPTLVVEVLSPSTALHDLGSKLANAGLRLEAYRGLDSVQEVVFVEPGRRRVMVYGRGTP